MGEKEKEKEISTFLSYVLRHKPDAIGLSLDNQGWADIGLLLELSAKAGRRFSREELTLVVEHNDKKRFTIEGNRIRAAQGHSVKVELGLEPRTPPETLYHGTASRFLESILATGIKPGSRRQVHLSKDMETATAVGRRHGLPVVLHVLTGEMHRVGHKFYLADNDVWLTDAVPPEFIRSKV